MSTIEIRAIVQPDGAVAIPRETLAELGFNPGDEVNLALQIPEVPATNSAVEHVLAPAEGQTLAEMLAGRTGLVSFEPKDVASRSEEYFAQTMDEKARKSGDRSAR